MNKLFYLLFITAGVIVSGTLIIFEIESGQEDSQINSMLDALWWTVATVTTVGYGDIVIVSDVGRIIAMFYMFFGIAILAISLSVLGTHFYKKRFEGDSKDISHAQKLILKRMDDLEKNQVNLEKNIKKVLDKLDKP